MSEFNSLLDGNIRSAMTTFPEPSENLKPLLGAEMQHNASNAMREEVTSLLTDTCNGFISRAVEAVHHPVETLGAVASSVGIGATLAFVAKNPELWAGRIGTIGKMIPRVAIPLLVLDLGARAVSAAQSEKPGNVIGSTLFDYGLMGAAGSAGYKAASIPGKVQTFLGPRPLTKLPKGVTLELRGSEAILSSKQSLPMGSFQVRLADGNGFTVPSRATGKLYYKATPQPMPAKLNDGSKVSYDARSTTVTSGDGSIARRFLNGTIEKIENGVSVKTYSNGSIVTKHVNGDEVTLNGPFGQQPGQKSLLTPEGFQITEFKNGDVTVKAPRKWSLSFEKSGVQVQHDGRYKILISPEGEAKGFVSLGRRRAGRTLEYDLGKLEPGQKTVTLRNVTLRIYQKPSPIDEIAGKTSELGTGWQPREAHKP